MTDRLENTHQPRDLAIPADLMPRKVEVKKSTVLLTVKNIPWNEETACVVGKNQVDYPHAHHSPFFAQ